MRHTFRVRLQKLAGRRTMVVMVVEDLAASRLQLRHGRARVNGLPALLLAIGSRNTGTALLAIMLLPAAVLGQCLRNALAWSE